MAKSHARIRPRRCMLQFLRLVMRGILTHHNPEPKAEPNAEPKPMLLHDLPMDVVLMIGERLDDASLRNFRAVSRDFRHAMHNQFVGVCVASLSRNPEIKIELTRPTSLKRVGAISRIPAIAEAISAVHIRVTIPLSFETVPFVAQACKAYDAANPPGIKGYNFLCRYNKCVRRRVDPTLESDLRAILGRLVKLRGAWVELFDVPLPVRGHSSDFNKFLLEAHWQNAQSTSENTKVLFFAALGAVSTVSESLHVLRVDNDARIHPGLYATGSTGIWTKYTSGSMANLTALHLVLPSWGLKTACFGGCGDLHGSVIISQLLRAAPNVTELKIFGTYYACLDPPTVSAIVAGLRRQTLKVIHLKHFVTTLRTLQQLFATQASSFRSLHFEEGALIQGSWMPLLRNYDENLHLHFSCHGYIFDLHPAGFDCIVFPATVSTNRYTQPLCEECAKWEKKDIRHRDRNLDLSMRCSKYGEFPYNTDPLNRGRFTPPSYGIQEYACEIFRLPSKSAAFRVRHKRVFEEGRLQAGTVQMNTLSRWNKL